MSHLLAAGFVDRITANLNLVLAVVIVAVGLFLYGWRDLKRFSLVRVRAISGIVQTDAIRRRVLWVIPLAMLGVVVVSQLQRAFDPADAMRQTVQACMFVTGVVVTTLILILAVTNLPREIENKVVFTVVTKPTTRLELIVGKIVGFARVSLILLAVMGVFVWGYCHLRAWNLGRSMDGGASRLLVTRTLGEPTRIVSTAAPATIAKTTGPRPEAEWMLPGNQETQVAFNLPQEFAVPMAQGEGVLLLELTMPTVTLPHTADQNAATGMPDALPLVSVQFLSVEGYSFVDPAVLNGGRPIELPSPSGANKLLLPIDPKAAAALNRIGTFLITVSGQKMSYLYGVTGTPIRLLFRRTDSETEIQPVRKIGSYDFSRPMVIGHSGQYGAQLFGPEEGLEMIARYEFRDIGSSSAIDGRVPVQMRFGIERSGAESDVENNTTLATQVVNRTSGKSYDIGYVEPPDSKRTGYFEVPAEAIEGGSFDVVIQNLTPGHVVGLQTGSLSLVRDVRGFGWNLLRGSAVLWLFTILVAAIAVCASTFLSWPIAFVFTGLALSLRWLVELLADSIGPGVGASIADQIYGANKASEARVVSETIDVLGKLLIKLASVLPDVSVFGTSDLVERGLTVPWQQMVSALISMLVFALPLTVLAYVFLRNKEVAP